MSAYDIVLYTRYLSYFPSIICELLDSINVFSHMSYIPGKYRMELVALIVGDLKVRVKNPRDRNPRKFL